MASVITNGELSAIQSPNYNRGTQSTDPVFVEYHGQDLTLADLAAASGVSPMSVWATQPSVRKVVDFAARAVASTPLKVYRRNSDTDRDRITDHPLARVLATPSAGTIPYWFWHSVIVDWLLFDRFAIVKLATLNAAKPLDLIQVQSSRVRFADDGLRRVTKVWVDGRQSFDPSECIVGHGYATVSANGTSPMQTLGAILQEANEAVAYRRSVWQRGARVPMVLERPATAPVWSDKARDQFLASWRKYARGGGSEGGTPILQDGMTLAKVEAFSPKDTQDIIGRQLSDAEVASAFHIAPELVGAREGTYSNVEAFRQMLYRDALGPIFTTWEQTINSMLVPDLDDTGLLYVEADVDAKLRGSFTEEAQVMSSATGAPWMTRNEARARKNLPAIDGGDELVTPLNVLIGGQASPLDSGSQNTTP